MSGKIKVNYVTTNKHKREENAIFAASGFLDASTRVADKFEFEILPIKVKETLVVDLVQMVKGEVLAAYSSARVPCFVEHGGLIFEDYKAKSYPGGLTKPMWNALGPEGFIKETASANRRAIARVVVGYCDGMKIHTFAGERSGTIADAPRGNREFYWDTIFIPDDTTGKAKGKTYAEIVEDSSLGLEFKVLQLSQSSIAKQELLRFLLEPASRSRLWG